MRTKELIIGVVGLAVCVIVAATVLMPILGDATKTEGIITNEGLYRMKEYQTTDTFVANWDHTKPNIITVNGVDQVIPDYTSDYFAYTLVGNEDFVVRYYKELTGQHRTYVHCFYDNTYIQGISTGDDVSFTLSSGVMTITNGTKTAEITLTDGFYCIDSGGDYIMKKSTDAAYVKSDSNIIGIGSSVLQSTGANVEELFMITGNIDDGFTATHFPHEATIGEITADDQTANINFKSVYSISKITFTVTYDTVDTDLTYSQILVPYQITAEKSQHLDSGSIAIINAIPIIIIVAMITMAVGFFLVKRE